MMKFFKYFPIEFYSIYSRKQSSIKNRKSPFKVQNDRHYGNCTRIRAKSDPAQQKKRVPLTNRDAGIGKCTKWVYMYAGPSEFGPILKHSNVISNLNLFTCYIFTIFEFKLFTCYIFTFFEFKLFTIVYIVYSSCGLVQLPISIWLYIVYNGSKIRQPSISEL